MPFFDFECVVCKRTWEDIVPANGGVSSCPHCGRNGVRLPPLVSIVVAGNMGPKLKNRVNLDTELKRQGFSAPLFKSEEAKDKARFVMRKEMVPWR